MYSNKDISVYSTKQVISTSYQLNYCRFNYLLSSKEYNDRPNLNKILSTQRILTSKQQVDYVSAHNLSELSSNTTQFGNTTTYSSGNPEKHDAVDTFSETASIRSTQRPDKDVAMFAHSWLTYYFIIQHFFIKFKFLNFTKKLPIQYKFDYLTITFMY